MTPRERMLTALAGEAPDRVPATVHQWQPFHLNQFLGGMSDIEAFRHFGLDASLARFPLLPDVSADWVVTTRDVEAPTGERRWEVTVTTPGGTMSHLVGENEITRWNITHLVSRPEELELIERYMPIPRLDREQLSRDREELGEDGILRGFVCGEQGGCWQEATCLVGTEQMILWACDDPSAVHNLMKVLLQRKLRFIEESLSRAPYDLIETGGGAASSTVISPRFFGEFCLPYDREMHEALHALGHKVVYHTCGGMMPILELIAENCCEACETLTPPAMGGDARPVELKQRVGGRLALIGGLDQRSFLEVGTPDEVRGHVHAMFEAFGPAGGYVMSPSDHFFHVPRENLEAYAAAARECVY